ncbi:MAG TPA: hypothetical protein PKZ58_06280, partial [Bacillota bacterium]|nr:hypothetical protein [Bacillota bacterium]
RQEFHQNISYFCTPLLFIGFYSNLSYGYAFVTAELSFVACESKRQRFFLYKMIPARLPHDTWQGNILIIRS